MNMWVVMIESLVGIVLFTVVIVSLTLKNPLTSVGDYPPAIQKRCIELGQIPFWKVSACPISSGSS